MEPFTSTEWTAWTFATAILMLLLVYWSFPPKDGGLT